MKLNQFKMDLISIIEKSELDVDCVYYVLKDILNEVTMQYGKQIQEEQQAKVMEAMGAMAGAPMEEEGQNTDTTVNEAEEINKTEEE